MPELIRGAFPLDFAWRTADPFLFCVHHLDLYPAGNARLGPQGSLAGRDLGQDFEPRDGWRMYHGRTVPGFPQHPHRGFETVTFVRRGYVDHADSLGARARYGQGDVQWLTAGGGIVHAEMFPLLHADRPNPVELYQIWLNLPAADKMAEPHFAMLWAPSIPVVRQEDSEGRAAHITVVAGRLGDAAPPAPPPRSWASRPDADVAIWHIALEPRARWVLPPARPGSNRTLYVVSGDRVSVAARWAQPKLGISLLPDAPALLECGDAPAELVLLQGRPIGEPVVNHGPFVMNSRAEIQQAFADYQRTRFGGWPWPQDDPVHGPEARRFARHPDGREETGPTG